MKNRIKDKLAKLEFWWAKKTIKDGRDFELTVDHLGTLVTVLRGKFESVQFRFGPMTLREEDEAMLDFSTVVVYNPKDADVGSEDFLKLSSNILRIMLMEAIEDSKYPKTEQVIDENRNVDTGEFDQERELHEEVSPLLEKRVSKRKSRAKAVPADSGVHPEIQQPAKRKRTSTRTTGKKGSKRK